MARSLVCITASSPYRAVRAPSSVCMEGGGAGRAVSRDEDATHSYESLGSPRPALGSCALPMRPVLYLARAAKVNRSTSAVMPVPVAAVSAVAVRALESRAKAPEGRTMKEQMQQSLNHAHQRRPLSDF
jgi:hypothetical protein